MTKDEKKAGSREEKLQIGDRSGEGRRGNWGRVRHFSVWVGRGKVAIQLQLL